MKLGFHYRQLLIASTFLVVMLFVLVLLLVPDAGKRQVSAYSFPQSVDLKDWQFRESNDLPIGQSGNAKSWAAVLAARKYSYTQAQQKLAIEMRYEVGTLGDISTYLRLNTAIKPPEKEKDYDIRQDDNGGDYSLLVASDRLHLLSCINPRGQSTVTSKQFMHNRYALDLQTNRLGTWLLGQTSLIDRRCLWADLSMPIVKDATPDGTTKILEQNWQEWRSWWSANFPPH